MLKQRHQEFDSRRCRYRREARARYRAHLVERPVCEGLGAKASVYVRRSRPRTHIRGRDDVIAVVAAQPLTLRVRLPRPMPHDQERVKAERGVQHHLALGCTEDRRQPARLARVHEEEYDVVLVNELLQRRNVLLRLLDRRGRDRVTRHRDGQVMSSGVLKIRLSIYELEDSQSARRRTTPGKIFFNFSAAHAALGFPPLRQSSKSNSGWRTGFENETRAESTNVIVRTPQP